MFVAGTIRPKTRAVKPAHSAGFACEMDRIPARRRADDLKVIEDIAPGWTTPDHEVDVHLGHLGVRDGFRAGRDPMVCTVVIPVYNGAATIGPLVERLIEVLDEEALRIVLVDDGSPDISDQVCRAIQARLPETVVYVRLAKNFGEHNAVMAGLHYVRGDYAVIMDDDFQNPPEEVRRLVEHAAAHGYDVVYASYRRKQHHWFRNLGSRFNNAAANLLLSKPRDLYLSSFKCLSLFTVREILKYSGPYPYIDGLILRCTQNIGTLEVRHDPRRAGRSNYTLGKLVGLWLNMFVNFSVMPLRVSTVMGFLFSLFGFLLGILVVIERLCRPETPIGWASVIVTVLLFSGVQLVTLGLLGEYLGRLFLTSNQTPQFVIREIHEGEDRQCTNHQTSIASMASRS